MNKKKIVFFLCSFFSFIHYYYYSWQLFLSTWQGADLSFTKALAKGCGGVGQILPLEKKRKRLLNVGFPTEKVLVSVFLVRYHHLDAGNRRCFLQWYWWLLWALPLLLLLLMWLGWQWLWGAAGGRQSRRLLLASGGPIATNKMGDHVHRDWKYNGGVFLVANTAQSLQKRRKVNKINKEILLQCSKVSLRTNRK